MDKRAAVIAYDAQEKEAKNAFYIPVWALELTDNDFQTAMFLKQVVFWSQRTDNPDGFYKSYEEWLSESRLNRYRISKAVKTVNELAGREVVTIRNKKVNGAPTLHYLLNWEALYNWICSTCANPIEQPKQIRFVEGKQKDLSTSEQIHIEDSDRELQTEIQTEDHRLHSFQPPPSESLVSPTATNEVKKIIQFSQDEDLTLKALCELCALEGQNGYARARKTLRKLAAMTPAGEKPPMSGDFIRFRYYMQAVNARTGAPTLSYVEDGWLRYLEWFNNPHAWTAQYWEGRGWPKGVEREKLLMAHDGMDYNPALMGAG